MFKLKIFILSFVLFTLYSCTEEQKVDKESRFAIIHWGFITSSEDWQVSKEVLGDTLLFQYVSLNDSSKTIDLQFLKSSNAIFLSADEYITDDSRNYQYEELSQDEFKLYYSKDGGDDATGPLVFNEDYGLVALINVYGPSIILLNEKNDQLEIELMEKIKRNF